MKKTIITFIGILLFTGIIGQSVVSYELLETITSETVEADFGVPAIYDVALYKVEYETLDVSAEIDTASGLLLIPQTSDALGFPLLCYQHGTVGSKTDVPSNLRGGYQIALIFGSLGYVTTAADFLGLGSSRGFHPYVHAASEASAAIDLLLATRSLSSDIGFFLNDQLFITGYSQGGHAAMAVHQVLEEDFSNEFIVTASAPLSGPYSISEKMIEATLGDEEYFFLAYLPYTVLSMKEAYPTLLQNYEIEDIFKFEYLADITQFRNHEIDLGELNNRMSAVLIQNAGGSFAGEMVHDSIRNIVLNGIDHPLTEVLRLNDTHNWAPSATTRLYYCQGDDQVHYTNSELAEVKMNDLGATDLVAVNLDPAGTMDHGDCVGPAVTQTVLFFALRQIITSDKVVAWNTTDIDVFPNPASTYLQVNINDIDFDGSLIITNATGKMVRKLSIADRTTVDVSNLPTGLYTLRALSSKKAFAKTFIISR